MISYFGLLAFICVTHTAATTLSTPYLPNSNGTIANNGSAVESVGGTDELGVSSTYYYYMNDPAICRSSTAGTAIYFSSYSQSAYVRAWSSTSYRILTSDGCLLSFSAYSYYKLEIKFSSGSYVGDCSTTLKVFRGSGTNGPLVGSYSCGNNMPTSYMYTGETYITIQLLNPYQSTNFDFSLQIQNYHDTGIGSVVIGFYRQKIGVVLSFEGATPY